MKIIVNAKHGGPQLSAYATREYAAKKGKDCYFYKMDLDDYKKTDYMGRLKYIPLSLKQVVSEDSWNFSAYSVNNINEVPEDEMENYRLLDRVEDDMRTDPVLIEIIERLGDAANSLVSSLIIVEIPDDVDWIIQDYDGMEWVAEKHRTWHPLHPRP